MRIDATGATDTSSRVFGSVNADILIGKFNEVQSGAGDDQITITSGFFRILAGDGNDQIEAAGFYQRVVDGGAGSDVLGSGAFNLVDIEFRDVINIETLEFIGTNRTYQLGLEVLQSGIRTIRDISGSANAIDASAMRDQTVTLTFDLGAGADQLTVGGVASNILLYDQLADSSGAEQDEITGF